MAASVQDRVVYQGCQRTTATDNHYCIYTYLLQGKNKSLMELDPACLLKETE